ncbi:hypothetical protein GCM10023237_17740 [Streptomyces coeruleoprunus]
MEEVAGSPAVRVLKTIGGLLVFFADVWASLIGGARRRRGQGDD